MHNIECPLPSPLKVWGLLMVAVVLIGPILALLNDIEKSFRARYGVLSPGKEFSVFDYSYNAFRSILYQDDRTMSQTTSLRLLFGFWYLFCCIVYGELWYIKRN